MSATLDTLTGEVIRPDHPEYEAARRIHNGMIDKRPAVIVRCRNAQDVAGAVAYARAEGLEIAVRGGGHNVAGRAICEGGLVVDLSQMKRADVDPAKRVIHAEPGLRWGEFNAATQEHGLAVTGGTISTTGIAGLTLGGGFGWLMGKFGSATDNLVEAEVVTADGRVLRASEDENADLFWGIRGGGGNFGVVTEFVYKLHPVGPVITGGFCFWPLEMGLEVLKVFREVSETLSDDCSLVSALASIPAPPYDPVAGIIACHVGPEEEAERELAPIRALEGKVVDALVRKPYEEVNAQYDFGFPDGALNYWKSSFLSGLPDEAIQTMVDAYAKAPSWMDVILLEDLHGAITRVPVDAMAIPHRQKGFNLLMPAVWTDPEDGDANIAWVRETYDRLLPFTRDSRYVNYLDDDEAERGPDPVRAAYGPNYDRLVEIKTKYDPDNVFHLNFNIPPRGA
jgi:FAD/FMN-containing dehydrogenase